MVQELMRLGLSREVIRHWAATGRVHRVHRGVYAVGSPHLSRRDAFLAAVLACGDHAALSHESAAALWGILRDRPARPTDVTVPTGTTRRRPGVVIHRRCLKLGEVTRRYGVPVTSPATTLLDLAVRLDRPALERAINEADRRDLIDPERLRAKADGMTGRSGVRALRNALDRHTFTLTRSELERAFLGIVRRAGLPRPQTRAIVNGFEVDFFWPGFGLVVETDGLRYHRTTSQQARDRLRDQTHLRAGLTALRFTHHQVARQPDHVAELLRSQAAAAVAPEPNHVHTRGRRRGVDSLGAPLPGDMEGRSGHGGAGQPQLTLTVSQVAARLAVSVGTVRRWADSGALESFRTPGGQRRFDAARVEEFLRSLEQKPGRRPPPGA